MQSATPRCGRRVLPVTLGPHHKHFGSARIARGLRAPDLVGAAPRTVARRAPWAREKGFDQDRRIIHDWPHQRVQSRQRGLEWIQRFLKGSYVAREGTCPTASGTEHCKRRFDDRLQNTILVFQPPWYRTEMPHGEPPERTGCWPRQEFPAGTRFISRPSFLLETPLFPRKCLEEKEIY